MTKEAFSPLPLARFDHVRFCYGNKTVFKDLSFRIEAGEHLVLLGPNGAGKSSLLRLLQGDLRSSPLTDVDIGSRRLSLRSDACEPGKIYWAFEGKEDCSALAAREHARLVSAEQQANYVRRGWGISGEEIILSGLDNAPMLYGEVPEKLRAAARELAAAAHAEHMLPVRAPAMSQGQLRLMLILRALIGQPSLLLLDEPFDGLDRAARKAVNHCLDLAVQRRCTLIITAHRRGDIPSFINKAFILGDGRIRPLDRDILKALSQEPKRSPAPEDRDEHEFLRPEPWPHTKSPFLRALSAGTTPLLVLRDVEVFVNRARVLADINWQVEPGEHWIVSGPNGSGKSTLMRLLYGEEFAAWGGNVEWCGGMKPSQEELRAGVGFVSDRLQHRYDYDLSAAEIVVSGLRGTVGLYTVAKKEELELACFWLERMGIVDYAATPLHALSGGTARKALLARALAGSPPVLLLDEPCTGLDAASRALFFSSLSVVSEQGVTIIYCSHREEDRSNLFNRELKLDNGRIAGVL